MNEDWRNAFGILMCREICDGAGARICDGVSSTCSSLLLKHDHCIVVVILANIVVLLF